MRACSPFSPFYLLAATVSAREHVLHTCDLGTCTYKLVENISAESHDPVGIKLGTGAG